MMKHVGVDATCEKSLSNDLPVKRLPLHRLWYLVSPCPILKHMLGYTNDQQLHH